MTTDADDWNWDRDPLEDEYPMAARLRRVKAFDHVARYAEAILFRRIMDHVGYWSHCPKPRCRRARKCVDEKAECAWRKLPYLQRHVFPEIRRLKEARLAELYAQETGADAESRTRPHEPPVL